MALATEFCRYQSDAGSHVTHPQSCDKVNKRCHNHIPYISLPSGMHSDAAIETALSNAVNYIPMCHEILSIFARRTKRPFIRLGTRLVDD